MKKIKVTVLCGGKSSEHEVSIMSANSVMENIDKNKFEITLVKISKEGHFNIDDINKADVIFPLLHGAGGEDGAIQGFCETLNKPYVGAGIKASALALDKIVSKQIWRDLKLPIPSFIYFTKKEWTENQSKIVRKISPPVFVKPANTGSSIGITKIGKDPKITSSKLRKKLIDAIGLAFQYHDCVIVEQAIDAREIEIGILGDDELTVSTPGEVIHHEEFYTYDAKYFSKKLELIIPAQLSKMQIGETQDLAQKAYKSLSVCGFARADFLLDKKTDKIYLNELNTIPGFTKSSMYPKLMEASGISYKELLTKLIELALEK